MIKLLKERLGQIGATHAAVHAVDRRISELSQSLNEQRQLMRAEMDATRMLAAQVVLAERRKAGVLPRLSDAEFRVFSQFGDDGIIQYLVELLGVTPHTFVEFGVADYREANTRFLLEFSNWRGLILEGSEACVRAIKSDAVMWRHDLTVRQAFIDRDNINDLISDAGLSGPLGLLSIDIDGNDYWVWEAITAVDPVIVVVEYNSAFGPRQPVTVPYDPQFARSDAHYSLLYYGTSLAALCLLAERKDYAFVGCNSAGNNAYFVRRAQLGSLKALRADEGFVDARFRESRRPDGGLALLSGKERLREMAALPLHDVSTGKTRTVSDIFNLS